MNKYKQFKDRKQQEINEFPMAFAFSDKQFKEGMEDLGLKETDTDKVYKLGGTGGFYRKTDAKKLHEMFDRHDRELQEAIDGDTTGDGFIYDMFNYELANHEYGYTGATGDTLDALGLTMEEINSNPSLLNGFKTACKYQWELDC